MNVDEEIKKLSEEEQAKFEKDLTGLLKDRWSCREYGLDYWNPNPQLAKEKLYRMRYGK